MKKIIIFPILILLMVVACVPKKKYDALNKQKKKSIDSLAKVLKKSKKDCEKMRYTFTSDAKYKKSIIDSLDLEVNRLTDNTTTLKTSLRDAIKEYETEKNQLVSYEDKLNQKSKLVDSLTNSLKEKQKRLAELEEMIERNKAEANKLKDIINEALNTFDKSELNVYLKDGKVYIAMEEKLLFKSGSSKIDKRGKEAVKKLGNILAKNKGTEILIEGHTDNVGSADLNWKLSAERALSIVNILQKNKKIDPKRITASGRGMYKPVADNSNKKGKQKNRRIEIILVPKLSSLYEMMNEK